LGEDECRSLQIVRKAGAPQTQRTHFRRILKRTDRGDSLGLKAKR